MTEGVDVYDVIVVGGGIAGAAGAALLAETGRRVLLCDRTPLPAPAVSTHFFGPSVLRFLQDLGVLDEVLAAGAPPLRHWHLQVQGGYYGGPMLPRSAHPFNLCVRRETLDAILLRAARDRGVEIRDRASVRSVIEEDGRVVGVRGTDWAEHAELVVGADGRGSTVARLVGAEETFDAGTRRCTFHAYWRDIAPLPSPALEMWHDNGDLVQVGRCDGDLWVVMLSAPPDHFAALRDDSGVDGSAYERRLRAIPGMDARIAPATRMSPVYGSGQLRNFTRRAAGPGWRLAGDAYCHKDPLYGAGIADSCAAATILRDTVTAWGTGSESDQQYASLVEERIGTKMRAGLDSLQIDPPEPGELAWIQGVLAHPALAFEMTSQCSALFAGLPPDRQRFWQTVADSTATLLDLPPATSILEPAEQLRAG